MPSEIDSILSLPTSFVGDQTAATPAEDARWQWADRIGAGLSLSCALHCLILPIALALTPSLRAALSNLGHPEGSGWLQWLLWSHQVEWAIALSVISFAGLVLSRGWLRHRQWQPLRWYLGGTAVLLIAAAELLSLGPYHGLLLASGGGLIAMAHWRNLLSLRSLHPR